MLDEGDGFKVKRIEVSPGQRLSYQTHEHRAEYWIVVGGTATCVIDGAEVVLATDERVYIEVGQAHRITNMHDDPLVIIEVQTGSYLGEDDIVRLEDDYGRAPRLIPAPGRVVSTTFGRRRPPCSTHVGRAASARWRASVVETCAAYAK